MINYNLEDWLNEEGMPPEAGTPDVSMGGAPQVDPYQNPRSDMPSADVSSMNDPSPNITNQMGYDEPEDISQDPHAPDMPEEKTQVDFENWRKMFIRESLKGDAVKLFDMLQDVRDKEGLNSYQRKFVEDNWNIQLLRQNANIDKATKDIRRNINEQLDLNNPATTVVNHMVSVLDTIPILNTIFIKLGGYSGLKGDLHRKYIAALLGGVQVGSGANKEDIIYEMKKHSILISTRFNAEFGEISLGSWALKEDDVQKYPAEPEKKRLEEGSPEEKEILRKRVVLESIVDQFSTRSFIFNVTDDDGMIYTIGWDISSCLSAAYTDGKLIVKTKMNEASEGMITDEGKIEAFLDLDINYTKETGQQTVEGSPEVEEIPFIQRKNGQLFLVAELKTLKDAASSMQGLVFKETPYNGNISDLKVLRRCVYSSSELLLRQC